MINVVDQSFIRRHMDATVRLTHQSNPPVNLDGCYKEYPSVNVKRFNGLFSNEIKSFCKRTPMDNRMKRV